MSDNLCSIALHTTKSKMAILAKPLILIAVVLWITSAYLVQPLIIGEEVFERWNNETVGVFTFKVLFILVAIGAIGGYFASMFKHNNTLRMAIHLTSMILVMMYIYVTFSIYS